MYIRFLFNIGECIYLVLPFWGYKEIYTLLHVPKAVGLNLVAEKWGLSFLRGLGFRGLGV